MKKARFAMRTIAQFLLAVIPNRSSQIATTTSLINGFSPSLASTRHFRTASSSSIGRLSNQKILRRGKTILSEHTGEHNWLVVGDGDFSYCASIAERLAKKSVNLYATVLEEESVHNQVYERSATNKDIILSSSESNSQHHVRFGIDATKLTDFFPTTKFRTIEFNFPHWGGKTNAKHNRQLLDDFMGSASEVLCQDGEIVISLCEGQGGFPASNAEEWKRSWLVAEYAAKHGLLLHKLSEYEPLYQQTSHRGKDRPWKKDGTAQRYIFGFPNQQPIDQTLQMSCRHELRIVLPTDFETNPEVSRTDILEGDGVYKLTQNFVADGIRMEVVEREILEPYYFNNQEVTLAIFLLNYSGESMPLTRDSADSIRSELEASVTQQWGFEIAKGGRLVSRPYPSHLLPSLIKESYERKAKANMGR